MSGPVTASPLTVHVGTAMYTFPGGRDVTVGRNVDCDISVADAPQWELISRVNAVLQYDGTQWFAIDKSRNGIFVNGSRVTKVPLHDDVSVALGAPDGPKLTFQLSTAVIRQLAAGTPPSAARPAAEPSPAPSAESSPESAEPPEQRTSVFRVAPPPPRPAQPSGPPSRPNPIPQQRHSGPQRPTPPQRPMPPQRQGPPPRPMTPSRPPTAPPPGVGDTTGRVSGAVKRVLPQRAPNQPTGAITIGRAEDSGIVVSDALVSRVHAFLVPTPSGTEIRDNRSSNGTFVNGHRVTVAPLRRGDAVTVGNTDLTFNGTTLVPREAEPHVGGVAAHRVGLVIDEKELLSDVSFTAKPGTLTAVIGPSGAGKSTLINVVGGGNTPSAGWVSFDGHDVHAAYASLRSRIGVVPQEDVVHRQLTVERALGYAAELRLPPDTSKTDREQIVARVLDELELTQHRDKRIDKLSGGQRKRVSVAMELLTGPSLLILDEPTSGLDPALDRQVMGMLRRLADAGRVVLVVTHSLTYLNMCDQVLLLAPGGKTAYSGPPSAIAAEIGTEDWADIFAWVSTNPDGAHQAYLARAGFGSPPPEPAVSDAPAGEPAHTSLWRQVATIARRQVRLIVSDRAYFIFLAVLPFVLGALSLVVPGTAGLGQADARGSAPNEPVQLLILLNIAAVFMGTALTIRDLVGERSIFRREQAVGLSASAYLAAKILVYSVAAAVQTAVLVAIVVIGKGRPVAGLLGSAIGELYLGLALTAIASAVLGLLLSSIAKSTEQILPMLVVTIMLSIVFAGGMIPVTGRPVLDQLSWFLPARWGYAASASTIDLLKMAPLEPNDDVLWRHSLGWWALDLAMLLLLTVVFAAVLRWRLRLPGSDQPAARHAPAAAGAKADASGKDLGGLRRWGFATVALLVVVGFVGSLSFATKDSTTRTTQAFPQLPGQGPAEEQDPVEPSALSGLLLSTSVLSSVMQAPALVDAQPVTADRPHPGVVDPAKCTGAVDPGNEAVYTADTGFTHMASSTVTDPTEPARTVVQYVTLFPSADDAAVFQDHEAAAWMGCANSTVTVGTEPAEPAQMGAAGSEDGRSTVWLNLPGRACQRALTATSNVVIDVRTCAPAPGPQAEDIVEQIADKI